MIIRKSPSEIEKMRASGMLVWRILDEMRKVVKPGITTMELEKAAEKMVDDAGARAAFKGYYVPAAGKRFPCVLCTSINEEVVHGVPSTKRALREGDIVKVDVGVQLEGYYGDSAATIPVGKIAPETARLLKVTEESLELAIQQMVDGARLFDVCGAVQRHVEREGFSVVREFVGHGIGSKLHEEPQVPNYVDPKVSNPRLREGVVLAIEPMVSAGGPETKVLSDRWTAVTVDGSRAAHFEHCVAVTSNGPWVLTRP
jgi:methionyl aminopeptidase